jgi:hypothetical protein
MRMGAPVRRASASASLGRVSTRKASSEPVTSSWSPAVVGVAAALVHPDPDELGAEAGDQVAHQVVGHRPWRFDAVQREGDGEGLGHAHPDRHHLSRRELGASLNDWPASEVHGYDIECGREGRRAQAPAKGRATRERRLGTLIECVNGETG